MLKHALPTRVQEPTLPCVRLRLQVQGVVQGVGFRPFIHRLAIHHHLNGSVNNNNAGVTIEVEGDPSALAAFQQALTQSAPPAAHIESITTTTLPPVGSHDFCIVESQQVANAQTLISPDLAICDDCLRELFDPHDRRYRYPFINCTNCGPRYTITRDLPYDRPLTTMADFALCSTCQQEYNTPEDRRFHAQPNACPTCGPQLEFQWLNQALPKPFAGHFTPNNDVTTNDITTGEEALQLTQRLLTHGGIVAVKGIGGYHLACDATDDRAVAALRHAKRRGDKPFAIMARDLASACQIAHVSDAERDLLTSPARPIVLLHARKHTRISRHVAPDNHRIGVMLPYAPLHHLLFAPASPSTVQVPQPWLVMTSANHANAPIIIDDAVAQRELGELAHAILSHNRPIHLPCDDSVMLMADAQPLPIRRARGYAPLPLTLPTPVPPTLAVGGEIKNAFCLAQGQHAFMSQHLGDMQTLETQECMANTVDHMQAIFRISPTVIACDLHPAYLSTQWAKHLVASQSETLELIQVQHHHAHIAALMAEHGLRGDRPVIGFCFDGTGYGTDGAIWGGEVLLAGYNQFERTAHLAYMPLPGGNAAIHKPYRMALAAQWAAGIAWDEDLPTVQAATMQERTILKRQLETGLNCVSTSSMGRLFDIVAALAGVRQCVSYEAQAAIELEGLSASSSESYRFALPTATTRTFDAAPILRAIIADWRQGISPSVIASRFHNAVPNLIFELSLTLRSETGLNQVALTGGVFQNHHLLHQTVKRLRAADFETLTHHTVPPNDGGLALGQAIIAAHRHQSSASV